MREIDNKLTHQSLYFTENEDSLKSLKAYKLTYDSNELHIPFQRYPTEAIFEILN